MATGCAGKPCHNSPDFRLPLLRCASLRMIRTPGRFLVGARSHRTDAIFDHAYRSGRDRAGMHDHCAGVGSFRDVVAQFCDEARHQPARQSPHGCCKRDSAAGQKTERGTVVAGCWSSSGRHNLTAGCVPCAGDSHIVGRAKRTTQVARRSSAQRERSTGPVCAAGRRSSSGEL